MHFGENQLSPSLIGLSPLPTAHPPGFQPWWVRASTRSYPRFTLATGSSLGFGSRARDYPAPFGLAFAPAPPPGLTSPRTTNSQAHSSKGTPSHTHRHALTDYRRTVSGTLSLPSRGTFHQSLTVHIHYRSPDVFRLTRRSWPIHTRFHGPRATRDTHPRATALPSPTGVSPTPPAPPNAFG